MTPHLTLYTGPSCSLCDTAKALIEKVAADTPLTLELVDITTDPALFEAHRYEIPVVAIDGASVANGHPGSVTLSLREAFFEVAEKTPA